MAAKKPLTLAEALKKRKGGNANKDNGNKGGSETKDENDGK